MAETDFIGWSPVVSEMPLSQITGNYPCPILKTQDLPNHTCQAGGLESTGREAVFVGLKWLRVVLGTGPI